MQVKLNLRIRLHEGAQRRHHQHASQRQTYAKAAPDDGAVLREVQFDGLDLREHALTALKEALPFVCQRDAPSATVKQANPELLLQSGNRLADGRRRKVELTPSASKAAVLCNAGKDSQSAEVLELICRHYGRPCFWFVDHRPLVVALHGHCESGKPPAERRARTPRHATAALLARARR